MQVSEAAKAFYQETHYWSKGYDLNEEWVTNILKLPNIHIIEEEEKALMVVTWIDNHPLFKGHKVALELLWYVKPEFRGSLVGPKMFVKYEQWARDNGCTIILADNIGDAPKIDRFYENSGYSLIEKKFMKELN